MTSVSNKFRKTDLGKTVEITSDVFPYKAGDKVIIRDITPDGGLATVSAREYPSTTTIIDKTEMKYTQKRPSSWKYEKNYYKKNFGAPASEEEFFERQVEASYRGWVYERSYRNPNMLSFFYYTQGFSLSDMAEIFGVHPKTVSRWMNYYGYRRFSEQFAQLVQHHGINNARKLAEPSFNEAYDENYV
jgi:AraC-like DNA-binding protein